MTDFTAFRKDHAGNLWIGTDESGGLLCYGEGRFKCFTREDGAPAASVISQFLDRLNSIRRSRLKVTKGHKLKTAEITATGRCGVIFSESEVQNGDCPTTG